MSKNRPGITSWLQLRFKPNKCTSNSNSTARLWTYVCVKLSCRLLNKKRTGRWNTKRTCSCAWTKPDVFEATQAATKKSCMDFEKARLAVMANLARGGAGSS